MLEKILTPKEKLPNSFYEARLTLIPKTDKDKTRKKITGQYPDENILNKIFASQPNRHIKRIRFKE
jgi:hypothetical protein